MQKTSKQQRYGIGKFLTVAIVIGATVIGAVLWSQHQTLASIEVQGWESVASLYRDSVSMLITEMLRSKPHARLYEIEQCIESIPYVQQATAQQIGTTLLVTISERIPSALLQVRNGAMFWLGYDGTLYHYAPYYAYVNTPVVMAEDTTYRTAVFDLLKRIEQFENLMSACSEVKIGTDGMIEGIFGSEGTRDLLGKCDDEHGQLEALAWLMRSHWWGSGLEHVDLRWNGRLILVTRSSGTVSEVNNGQS